MKHLPFFPIPIVIDLVVTFATLAWGAPQLFAQCQNVSARFCRIAVSLRSRAHLVNSANVRRCVRWMGGNRCETWESTIQISVQWRKPAGDGTPFLGMQAISKKSSLRLTSISRLEKATWKIGTGAPPRIAVHHSADFSPFARDARSKQVWVWECSSRPQGCLLPDTELVVTAPARL